MKRPRATMLLVGLVVITAASTVAAAPFGAAARATLEGCFSALDADPFADEPLQTLLRLYDRGPGRPELLLEARARRAGAHGASSAIVLGRVALALGHRDEGLRALVDAEREANDPQLQRRLGRLFDDLGDGANAERAYRRGLVGASAQEQAAMDARLGALLLARKDVAGAVAAWAEAKRVAPNDQALRRQIAEALAGAGASREALTELKALEPMTRDPIALIAIERREADLANRAGDRKLAAARLLEAYLVAARAAPDRVRVELTMDLVHTFRADKTQPAVARKRGLDELLPMAREVARRDPAATVLVGELTAERGDVEGARTLLRASLATRPKDTYLLRRLCALDRGEDRLRDLRSLMELQRSDSTVVLDLIAAQLEASRPADAAETARTLLLRFPDSALELGDAGRLLGRAGQHEAALPLVERVLTLEPNRPDAILALADEQAAFGHEADATRTYHRLLGDSPTANDYRALMRALRSRRRNADVSAALDEAIAHNPDDLSLARERAAWLAESGHPQDAVLEWRRLQARAKDAFTRSLAEHEVSKLERQILMQR